MIVRAQYCENLVKCGTMNVSACIRALPLQFTASASSSKSASVSASSSKSASISEDKSEDEAYQANRNFYFSFFLNYFSCIRQFYFHFEANETIELLELLHQTIFEKYKIFG